MPLLGFLMIQRRKGTMVEKLTEETLRDQDHLKELLSFCLDQRQIGETSLNEMSSRSHQILRLTIESSAREFSGMGNLSTLAATINFVDLAGSERASQALTVGFRLKEGCHINRSLLTLGTVIRKLSKGRNGHIPYRDSKLTRILQSSLGGNAKTAIICTMSPARTHIEQSRNTLLFASCAKEVVNNAQVNVVTSDKALVKHLQRELVRLESELRCIVPTSTSNPDALKEKDVQIRRMEKEMKELMQQRDLAQSRLEDLLKALGDDQGSRQSEELSQYSTPRAANSSEDTFSTSESSQSRDFGNAKFDASSGTKGCTEPHLQLYGKTREEHAVSFLYHSASTTSSMGQEEVSDFTSHDFEDHYKEVLCIEMVEPSMNIVKDCNILLTEESDSLLSPSIHAQEKEGKGWALEPSPIPLVKISSSSRSQALARSRSCRATITGTSSPWFHEEEEDVDTPPNIFLKDFPRSPEGTKRTHCSTNLGAESEKCSQDIELNAHSRNGSMSQASEQSSDDDVLKPQNFKSCPDEGVTNISNTVEGLKEMAKMQYQKRLADGQDTENSTNCDTGVTVNDVCLEPTLESSQSPSRWPLEFEKKQRDIVELWHACSVSLTHRSYFFLLIKGDPTDSFYTEVEYRRLCFLKNSSSEGSVDQNGSFALSLRNLRREREKLCRGLNRFSAAQRVRLYANWGIVLDSKKRRVQLSRRVWTDTKDMERARESAMLVAKVFRFLEPAQAPKEMFGLSFTQQLTSRRSFGWRH
ncbi:kinesin-like protein KIN-7F isoform X2 [Iris pallida]|uniref:Kinesin-like protein n=1 Tax=Iris pallida TaxID=29817 RepID=A0AAX6FUF0_IRIPA|nr:kinesin-like protein KIN-7F isoform X2 [Iris pallida]